MYTLMGCPQWPEKGVGSPGARVIGFFLPLDLSAGIQTLIFKSNKCS